MDFSAFLLYVSSVIMLVFVLVLHFSPRCGHTNVLVYTGICSLMGSLSVNYLLRHLLDFFLPSDLYFSVYAPTRLLEAPIKHKS